jgi:hypothetical protein
VEAGAVPLRGSTSVLSLKEEREVGSLSCLASLSGRDDAALSPCRTVTAGIHDGT